MYEKMIIPWFPVHISRWINRRSVNFDPNVAERIFINIVIPLNQQGIVNLSKVKERLTDNESHVELNISSKRYYFLFIKGL